MTLSELGRGDSAEIEQIRLPDAYRIRLMELGMLRGVRVRLLRTAPGGDPMIVSLHGYELMLRRSDAAGITVCRTERAAGKR